MADSPPIVVSRKRIIRDAEGRIDLVVEERNPTPAAPAPAAVSAHRQLVNTIMKGYVAWGFKDDERSLLEWAKGAGDGGLLPTPVLLFANLQEFVKEMNARNVERNAKIEALEQRCAALEQQPQLKHCGKWREDAAYKSGSLVTRNGGLWLAERDTAAQPGNIDSGFRLIVKSGTAQ